MVEPRPNEGLNGCKNSQTKNLNRHPAEATTYGAVSHMNGPNEQSPTAKRDELFTKVQGALDAFGHIIIDADLLELDNEHKEQLLIALKALKESVLEHGVQLEPRCDRWSIEKGVEWLFRIFDPQRFPKAIEHITGDLFSDLLSGIDEYEKFVTTGNLPAIYFKKADVQKQKLLDEGDGCLI